VNTFFVLRRRYVRRDGAKFDVRSDLAVPLIDGVELTDMLDDRDEGVSFALVSPPGGQWTGSPTYVEYGRPVILDGTCGIAGCCGVVARITIDREVVRWHDFYAHGSPPLPSHLDFTFERSEYEAAIEGASSLTPHDRFIRRD